jgi:hypothetical protein
MADEMLALEIEVEMTDMLNITLAPICLDHSGFI